MTSGPDGILCEIATMAHIVCRKYYILSGFSETLLFVTI
ncbi:hypothetical protein CAter10_3442 [Collimonas arenae]|nr:hypothetical protein CAter10_3442 [Collimonas arenae]